MSKFVLCLSVFASSVFAAVPEPIITSLYPASNYLTVAGRLNSKPTSPVGISVRSGNTMYSTVTDFEGRWALVVSLAGNNVTARSWSLTNEEDRSDEIVTKLSNK